MARWGADGTHMSILTAPVELPGPDGILSCGPSDFSDGMLTSISMADQPRAALTTAKCATARDARNLGPVSPDGDTVLWIQSSPVRSVDGLEGSDDLSQPTAFQVSSSNFRWSLPPGCRATHIGRGGSSRSHGRHVAIYWLYVGQCSSQRTLGLIWTPTSTPALSATAAIIFLSAGMPGTSGLRTVAGRTPL